VKDNIGIQDSLRVQCALQMRSSLQWSDRQIYQEQGLYNGQTGQSTKTRVKSNSTTSVSSIQTHQLWLNTALTWATTFNSRTPQPSPLCRDAWSGLSGENSGILLLPSAFIPSFLLVPKRPLPGPLFPSLSLAGPFPPFGHAVVNPLFPTGSLALSRSSPYSPVFQSKF
jgi:hypothetical protein